MAKAFAQGFRQSFQDAGLALVLLPRIGLTLLAFLLIAVLGSLGQLDGLFEESRGGHGPGR